MLRSRIRRFLAALALALTSNLVLVALAFSPTPSGQHATAVTPSSRLHRSRFVRIRPRFMKNSTNSRGRSIHTGGDGALAVANAQRVRTAGRKGTKSFVDPTKLFLGNLNFQANETDVMLFFKQKLGSTFNVRSVKVIRDWKTHQSKGYGFALFSDPIYATSAMEICNNQILMGRAVKVTQGQKKRDPNELYIKKKKKKALTEEEQAIQDGLDEAEDPDGTSIQDMIALEDFDNVEDAILFGDDADEDSEEDFEFDGVFEDLYPVEYEPLTEEEQQMNREQRRDAAKRKKRQKLPHKGFESQPES